MNGFCKMVCIFLAAIFLCSKAVPAYAQDGGTEEMDELSRYLLMEAQIVPTPPYPNSVNLSTQLDADAMLAWWAAKEKRSGMAFSDTDQINRFVRKSVHALLTSSDTSNVVYSPVNFLFCLYLLSGITAHESREQILTAMEMLSDEQMQALWNLLYWDDGVSACIPSVSLWLSDRVEIAQGVLENLSAVHRASVFRGNMEEPSFNTALQAWLEKQTRGRLGDFQQMRFSANANISLSSALYVRDAWSQPFLSDLTKPGVFYASGGEITVPFMYSAEQATVYQGESFLAVARYFREGGCALFILPAESTTLEAVLKDDEVYRFLSEFPNWESSQFAQVRFSVPKLDFLSEISLREFMEAWGIQDVFDPEKADFQGTLLSDAALFLSSMEQISRLTLDEEGVEAASVTVANVFGALANLEEEIDFRLDRPFLMALMSESSIPLFVSAIRCP